MTITPNPLLALFGLDDGPADPRLATELAALAVRGAGIGTWVLDVHSGQAWWDAQMWALRGLPPRSDAPGREEQLSYVHADDREAVREAIAGAIAQGGNAQYEFRVVRPDGEVRWLASRSSQIADERGDRSRRIGVNWDITDAREADRIRQESELARREARAQSALLARMSHELRTPLNAVLGFAQLMLADADAAAQTQHERLLAIQSAGQQLLAMVDEVLALTEGGQRAGAHATPQAAPAPQRLLLYVEDNPVNALIVSELVRRRPDLQLHIAATGLEGVRRAELLSPSLVLLDMQLPDIDGFEVLERLRRIPHLARTPIIALSANAMPQDIQRALDAGMSAYWTKPLDFKVFTASIDAMFGPPPAG